MKILVRGDCTARRAVALNQDLFGGLPHVVVNCKARTDFFVDHLSIGTPTAHELDRVLRVADMKREAGVSPLHQLARTTLEVRDADLLVMCNSADMTYEAWAERGSGRKLWVDTRYLRDEAAFGREYASLGPLTFAESLEAHVRLIEAYRRLNGPIPVLYLNQPVIWHPPAQERGAEFRAMGPELAARLPDVYPGDVDDSLAVPVDMDSIGPGWTRHVDGPTYRRMLLAAVERGLGRWLP